MKNVLVLASTFPRFKKDTVPAFVLDYCKSLTTDFHVTVLAPHDKGARIRESIDNIDIWRFPYFIPHFERVAYRGGMINAWKQSILVKCELPFFLLSELMYTIYIAKKKNIDVINAHWLFPQGFIAYIAKLFTGKKVIITTHGGDIEILKNKYIFRLLKPTLDIADSITFVSKHARDKVAHLLKDTNFKKKAYIVPMGVTIPRYHSNNTKKEITLLFIGRLVAIKGLNYLLDALQEVIRVHPHIKLYVLGDGPLKQTWQKLTNTLGLQKYVIFKGFIQGNKKFQYISHSDIVVVPSIVDSYGYQEGLPVAALEAMAYGKVLIATRTGGLPELINSQNGILVEPNNSHAIADALITIIPDIKKRIQISQAARETAKLYSWDEIHRKVSRIITQ